MPKDPSRPRQVALKIGGPPHVCWPQMAGYRIEDHESEVAVEVTDVGPERGPLLEAFGECQAGHCSCPTDEYRKLKSMEVEQVGDSIRLRLEAKPGERFDTSEIAACLDYATGRLTEPRRAD